MCTKNCWRWSARTVLASFPGSSQTHLLCYRVVGNSRGGELSWILRFCGYLQKFPPRNLEPWYPLAAPVRNLQKFSLWKFVFSTHSWKFSPAKVSHYMICKQWRVMVRSESESTIYTHRNTGRHSFVSYPSKMYDYKQICSCMHTSTHMHAYI